MLALRPGALGDTLLAVPALRALRTRWPGAEVTLAAQGAAARLLAARGEVDVGLSFDDPRLGWLWSGTAVPASLPDAVVGWVSDADGRLHRRLSALGVGRVLLASSRPADSRCHVAHYLWWTLAPLAEPLPAFDDGVLRVSASGAGASAGAVLLHRGSGSARKNWPARSFAAVADLLLARGTAVRLVVGEADGETASQVERALGRALPRLTEPSLGALARTLAGCQAYLGNDSGVSHLAGLVGAPTFALFGPTDPRQWRPLGPRVTVLPFDMTPVRVAVGLLRD